jgi:hypothetical protein
MIKPFCLVAAQVFAHPDGSDRCPFPVAFPPLHRRLARDSVAALRGIALFLPEDP